MSSKDVTVRKPGVGRKIVNVLTTVLLVLLVAIVILVFIARVTGHSPSVFGYHIFRVSSGSMEPTLNVGDVILVKSPPPSAIHENDIVTYNGLEGDFAGKVITHRVVEEPEEDGGIWYFQTQGDVEGSLPDPKITYDQIEGKFITKLTVLNHIYSFFLSPYGLITFVFIIIALFGYEMISLVLSYRSLDEKDDDYYEPKNKKKSKKRKKNK